MSIVFKNKPNKKVKTEEGETVYLSRACSVVAEIFLYSVANKSWYVLLGKRGEKAPDYRGYWGFPCGYLDWDETLYEATCREVWEETGVVLVDLKESVAPAKFYNLHNPKKPNSHLPWKITDEPYGERQNVSFHYGVIFKWDFPKLPVLSIANANPGEADDVSWVKIEEAFSLNLAFNHTARLKELWLEESSRFEEIERGS